MLSDAPEYTVEGLIGVAMVNAEWANAIFYCEDSGHEAVYERLLNKLCPELKKFMVACTGGKTVIQKLAERREDIPIPYFLLVDKDYDDLNGFLKKRRDLGISYFREYSLENYISQLDALLEVAVEILSERNPGLTISILKGMVTDRQEYLISLIASLEDIGRYFVVCQNNRIKIKTCKTSGIEIFPSAADQSPSPQDWFEKFKISLNEYISANTDWMLVEGSLSVN